MRRYGLTLAALGLAVLMLTAALGRLPLTQPDEGRNALVAAEMQASGSWLVPTFGQVEYLDKPSFFFKLVGLSLALFGHNEAAARLPSALAALMLIGATWAFTRRAFGTRAAALAALVLATTPLFVTFGRLVIFDMVLTLFVSVSILAGHLAEQTQGGPRRRWYLAAASAAGAATLVKGPVGFVVPALVHLVAARVNGGRGVLRRALAPANVAVFLAVVLPWFVGVSLQAPDFPYYGIVHETFRRFTSPSFHRNQPPWFYVLVLGFGALPFSLLVPGAARAAWRDRRELGAVDRLCLVWSFVVVLFFTASRSKQPAYVLSVFVPLAILSARVLVAALEKPEGGAARQVWGALLLLAGLVGLGGVAAAVLRAHPDVLARLPGPSLAGGALWLPFLPDMVLVCGGFLIVAVAARLRRSVPAAVACLVLLLPALLVAAVPALAAYADVRSSRGLALQILTLPEGTEVGCLRCFPSALPFYLGRPVTLVSADASELRSNYVLFAAARDAALPSGVVAPKQLDAWLAGRQHPVYLLAGDDDEKALRAIAVQRGVALTRLSPDYWAALLPPSSGS
jgi:4-amino-4-deoxy-L-arabinose transferase-like glycosyltransferase